MKTLKTILSVFAFVAILSTGALAQSNADVAVTAEVQAVLNLTPSDISLGDIQQASSTIQANANDAASNDNIGVGASAGSLQITGTSGVDIDVSWTTATLSNGTPAEDAVFTPSVYNGAVALTSGGTIALTGGDITLDVGGTLAAPGGTGTYTSDSGTHASASDITFTVQYN